MNALRLSVHLSVTLLCPLHISLTPEIFIKTFTSVRWCAERTHKSTMPTEDQGRSQSKVTCLSLAFHVRSVSLYP